jgi:hypothetical protein
VPGKLCLLKGGGLTREVLLKDVEVTAN